MSSSRVRATAGVIAGVGVVALLASLTLAGGGYTPAPSGLPDAGPLVGWGLPIVRFATDLAGALTVGWLVCAAFLDPGTATVSKTGRRDLLRAVIAAGVWAVLAITQLFFTLALILGVPLGSAVSPTVAATYAMDIPATRSLAVVAIVAAAIAVGALLTASTGVSALWTVVASGAMALPALVGHGAGLGDHALALSAGTAHVIAATLWLGPLAAILVHAILTRDRLTRYPVQATVKRFGVLASVCVALLAASGLANAYTRLDRVDQLWSTGYGQVVLVKIVVMLGLIALAAVIRRRIVPGSLGGFVRWVSLEVALIVISFALGVTLALSAYPRAETRLPTIGETMLGFLYPPEPNAANLAFGFHLEPLFFVGVIVALALYIGGLVRLRRRGDAWPWGRTISWILGLVIVMWTTNGGASIYAQVSIGWHMVQHMTMTMLAPILLVLGAPATLALRALRPATGPQRGPREWLLWLLHSPLMRVLTNPIYVLSIYVLGLYGLYFTGLFGWLMGSHIGHVLMEVHFLATGYLFAWIIIGIDPRPKPLPYWARFLILLIALALHAFFAIALMMRTTPMAVEWYGFVRPPWISDPMADTTLGGQIAWGLSEVPTLVLLIAMGIQWARADDREGRRLDRQADRDDDAQLRAYNDYLASLNERKD